MIHWTSNKYRRVSHSSCGPEIPACAGADDRGFHFKSSLRSTTRKKNVSHILIVHSQGLYDTIFTLDEGKEYILGQTVVRTKNSFKAGELDTLRVLPGSVNIAYRLTKRNPGTSGPRNAVACNGYMKFPSEQKLELDSNIGV